MGDRFQGVLSGFEVRCHLADLMIETVSGACTLSGASVSMEHRSSASTSR